MKMYNKKKAEMIIQQEKEKDEAIAILVCDERLSYIAAERQVNDLNDKK